MTIYILGTLVHGNANDRNISKQIINTIKWNVLHAKFWMLAAGMQVWSTRGSLQARRHGRIELQSRCGRGGREVWRRAACVQM